MSTYEKLSKATPFQTAFDVDPATGFMPPEPPLRRLPQAWEAWEVLLDEAIHKRLAPGDKVGLTMAEATQSERWRASLRAIPLISTTELLVDDEPALARRAHVVLTFLLSFYIHTLPPRSSILIPKPLSIPLLQVSNHLGMPPVVTYSDTVLYNWELQESVRNGDATPGCSSCPATTCATLNPATARASFLSENIRAQTTFTGLTDEEAFYETSAKIELRGVEALDIMRSTMDELFVSDSIAVTRVTKLLQRFAVVVADLKKILLDIRPLCDPERYYNDVRPFFRGEDSSHEERRWVFEGLEEYPDLVESGVTKELSGASAAQSSLIYALDAFLGVKDVRSSSFMARMQKYVPKNHRLFLDHLADSSRPLRSFVMDRADGQDGQELKDAYNASVNALKEFRDGHMIIAALYIVGPARRARNRLQDPEETKKLKERSLKGTGGTDMVKFLKGVRDQTKHTMISPVVV
ncbi:hypothetical protein V5O48_005139 [Marasmius crinis-equi]|uniref:Indoleamine 2,3-dioxygenase n=1 Tax=Marasmius crinis-equi TaxID=585013 RepID=A0ABR3FN55_9AGAR